MTKVIDNFFHQNIFQHFVDLTKTDWTVLGDIIHKDLKDTFYTEKCVDFIGESFQKKFKIYRSAMHGLALNTKSRIHQDVNSTHTALLFINPNWKLTWNGGTFFGSNCEQYIQFRPNRMILFETKNLDHVGSTFSAEANEFRFQAIWHLNEQK